MIPPYMGNKLEEYYRSQGDTERAEKQKLSNEFSRQVNSQHNDSHIDKEQKRLTFEEFKDKHLDSFEEFLRKIKEITTSCKVTPKTKITESEMQKEYKEYCTERYDQYVNGP